jgi:hypothetical protein
LRVALQVVLIIDERLERRCALAGCEVGIEGLEPVEMVDRQVALDPDDRGGVAGKVGLVARLEHVVRDLVGRGQLRPVDRLERGQIMLDRRAFGGQIRIGQIIAEPVRIAQITAEDPLDRIAFQARLVAVIKHPLEPRIVRTLTGLRDGRRQRLRTRRGAADGRGKESGKQQFDGQRVFL